MKKIWKVFASDFRRITASVVAVVVIMGLCLIPSLYAWFNILSNWDPYGPDSTSNIKVAVANEDDGCELIGLQLNVGEMVLEGLESNDQMGWVFVDSRETALSGVNSGEYYAALIVPHEFTADFMSILNGDLRHPQIDYYENQKKNAIAPKITNKAKTAVQDQINSTVLEKAADTVNTISSVLRAFGLDADDLADKLVGDLNEACSNLDSMNVLLRSVQDLLGDTSNVLDYSSLVVDEAGHVVLSAGDTIGSLGDAAGVGSSAAGTLQNSVSLTLNDIDSHLSSISDIVTGNTEAVVSAVENILSGVEDTLNRISELGSMTDQTDNIKQQLDKIKALVGSLDDESSRRAIVDCINSIIGSFNEIKANCSGVSQQLAASDAHISQFSALLKDWDGSEGSHQTLNELMDTLRADISGIDLLLPSAAGAVESVSSLLDELDQTAESIDDPVAREEMADTLEAVTDSLNNIASVAVACSDSVSEAVSAANSAESYIDSMTADVAVSLTNELSYIEKKLSSVAASEKLASATLNSALDNVHKLQEYLTSADSAAIKTDVPVKIAEIRENIRMAALNLNTNVGTHIQTAASKAQAAIYSIRDMVNDSGEQITGISRTLAAYGSALGKSQSTLDAVINLSQVVRDYLAKLATDVQDIKNSEAFRQLMDVIDNNPDGLAEYLCSPVSLSTVVLYSISDYGSAMSPYYIMLALFVGSLLAATMVKVQIKSPDLQGLNAPQRYFGRFLLFFFIGMMQALATSLGCLYYVGIQCVEPGLFILACCICSLNFAMMNFALVYSLDNIGMAAAVIIMVIQVAGSGGSYPVHVLPDVFQKLYPFMPFHYGMDMIRETVGGMYGSTYARCAGILLGMCVLFTAFGMLVYYPARKLNKAIADAKEKTGIM